MQTKGVLAADGAAECAFLWCDVEDAGRDVRDDAVFRYCATHGMGRVRIFLVSGVRIGLR